MDEILAGLRDRIMKDYGLDIQLAESFFSTQNYAFIFPDSPYMIRVSIGSSKSRNEALSEVMWVDDLKQFSESVCEPAPSNNDRLIEEFEIDGQCYRTAMFRTAKGKTKDVRDAAPVYFVAVGDLLGRIHAASEDAQKKGLHYKRPDWNTKRESALTKANDKLEPEIMNTICTTMQEIQNIPKTDETYGMIHGDFHSHNFFVDGNNVWVFDFDDCCYGYYMYDIASVCNSWLSHAYSPNKTRSEALYEDILPFFRIGYESHKKLSEEYWDKLELFIKDRQCVIALALAQIDKSGIVSDLEAAKKQVCIPLYAENPLQGMDLVLKNNMGIKLKDEKEKSKEHSPQYSATSTDDEVTVLVSDKLTAETAPKLDQQVADLVAKGVKRIVFDFENLTYISSMGIRVILKTMKQMDSFRIIHANDMVREVLTMVGLEELIDPMIME